MNRFFVLVLIPVALALSACGKKEQALPTLGDAGKSAPQAVAPVAITPAAPSDAEQGEFVAKMQKELDEVKGHISELRQTVNTRSGEAKSKLEESISKLEAEQRIAEAKLTEIKTTLGEKWKEMKAGLSESIERMNASVKQAKGGAS